MMQSPGGLVKTSFPVDGDTLYVVLSVVIFGSYDRHKEMRRKIWDLFSIKLCRSTLESAVLAVPPHSLNSDQFDTEWFLACVSSFDARVNGERHGMIDFSHPKYAKAIQTTIKLYSQSGAPAPPLEVVAPFVCDLFNVAIVLYRVDDPTTAKTVEQSRTWYPPDYLSKTSAINHIHLMLECGGIYSLLLRPSPAKHPIPTRVIGRIHLNGTDSTSAAAWSDPIVEEKAIYRLAYFNKETKRHHQVGPFVAPATGRNPNVSIMHYMWLDARLVDKNKLVFVIKGCQEVANSRPLFFYALKMREGQRYAMQIGHWAVDYTDPTIGIVDDDEGIAIIPASDELEAAQIIMQEAKCTVIDMRTNQL